jgi:heme exporter protein D
MFLPVRNYVFDTRDLSAFHDVAELGGFVWVAVLMIVVGLVVIGLSFLVRGEMSD